MPRRIEQRARWVRASQSILDNTPDGWTSSTGGWSGGSSTLPAIWVGEDDPFGFIHPTYGQKLAAVSRATGLIADTLAGVPWQVFRGRDQLPSPPWLWDPMNAQNDATGGKQVLSPLVLTGVQFWSWIITDMLWHGEAFLIHDGPLDSSILYPVSPLDVEDVNPRLGIKIGDGWVSPDKVIHMRGRAPYRETDSGGYRGVGVLSRHAATMGLAASVDLYAGDTFQSGVPAGYLKATQAGLTPDDAEALAARWMEKHGQRRQVAVLGNSVEFVPVNMSPVDAELIKMQDFTLREIAHAFGMSAHYLDVAGSTDTYANVRDRAVDFRQFTLLPWARLIESELDTVFPRGTNIKLRLDGLERGTTNQRFDDYTKALAGGWMTVDEIRELENLPPLEAPDA